MTLYDLKFRNLNNEELASVSHVLFSDNQVFVSDRAVSIEIDQDGKNRNLWNMLIYHLRPNMMVRCLALVVAEKVYPVIVEIKK